MAKLTTSERATLQYLSECGGGFTAGTIARNCGGGSSRSTMAVFRHHVLLVLLRRELIDLIDAKRPAIFVITELGRRTLEAGE